MSVITAASLLSVFSTAEDAVFALVKDVDQYPLTNRNVTCVDWVKGDSGWFMSAIHIGEANEGGVQYMAYTDELFPAGYHGDCPVQYTSLSAGLIAVEHFKDSVFEFPSLGVSCIVALDNYVKYIS